MSEETFAIPSRITEMITELTGFRRLYGKHSAMKQAITDREVRIESLIPGYSVVWNAEIQAYGLVPDSVCNGGQGSRFD